MDSNKLIKIIEAILVIGLCGLGVELEEMTLLWAVVVSGGYLFMKGLRMAKNYIEKTVNPENPRPGGNG